MRKFHILLLTLALLALSAHAIPADPTPATVAQSDGTTLTLRLVGDEFFHYCTTDDGYTVVRNSAGNYEYARLDGDRLAPSGQLAHDAGKRNMAERQLLAGLGKHLTAERQIERGRASRSRVNGPARREPTVDYSAFRGLIILVNYTDKKFDMDDPHDFYDKMVNERDYTGFQFNGRKQNCTGSMRDYFYDQSGGIFDPQFDIVGPIEVPYSCRDHGGTSNSWRIFWAALDAVDEQVDFSHYDNDGDGMVDMVYFLVAGYSANYSGNDGNYLWPHKSFLYNYEDQDWLVYDGVAVGTYASSCEVYGWESQGNSMPLGIGTMCHEFSHVLGLPDLYDTDYAQGGGQSHDPGNWDVMAGGGSYYYGRTPCGYTAWERYALGWANPQVIMAPGQYTLNYVGTTGDGFILPTPVANEYFMLDNRQRVKWDAQLPGHGLLIARVDSTDTRVWDWNRVNANPAHNYYELLRAGNSTSGAQASDPFPGTAGVTSVTNLTQPSLRTWAQVENDFEIRNITERNGVITFTVAETVPPQILVEDFEAMPVTGDKNAKGVQGSFSQWNFTAANVASPDAQYRHGDHAVAMVKPSLVAMTQTTLARVFRVEFTAFNSSSVDAKFVLYSSTDGVKWDRINTEYYTVPGNGNATIFQNLDVTQPTCFRLTMAGGSDKVPCYVDDFKLYYYDLLVLGDVNGDGTVDVADINEIINVMLGKSTVASADVNGDGVVDVADINKVINLMLSNQ